MRVLRYGDIYMHNAGGFSGVIRSTTDVLCALGHEVQVVGRERLPLSWCPSKLRRVLVPFAIAGDIVRRNRRLPVDVVEVHEPSAAVYAVARRLAPRLPPLVVASHGLEERHWAGQRARWRVLGHRGPVKSRVLVPLTLVIQAKVALRLADAIVVLSTEDFEHLAQARRSTPSTFLVPNGVSGEFLETPLAAPPPPFRVIFIGSWLDRKGVHELLAAWRYVHAVRAAELILVGTGTTLEGELKRLTRHERAAIHVEPTVTPGRMRELLASAHVFVLAGWFEGMPLSALEAMASGVPAVLGNVCGNRDLLSPEAPEQHGGLLVRPNDVADLRAALMALSEDESRRGRLAQAARARARQFSWARTARGLESAYRRAAEQSEVVR